MEHLLSCSLLCDFAHPGKIVLQAVLHVVLNQGRGEVDACSLTCTPRATLLARHLIIEDQPTVSWADADVCVLSHHFTARAATCPSIGLSSETSQDILDFLTVAGLGRQSTGFLLEVFI
jgi:hypothetical protein